MEEFGAVLKAPDLDETAGTAITKRYICMANTILRRLASPKFVLDENPNIFILSRHDENTLATSNSSDMVFLLCPAKWNISNPDKIQEDFEVDAFFIANAQFVRALWALFLEISSTSHSLHCFVFAWWIFRLRDYAVCAVQLSEQVFKKILNGMRLFLWD